MKLHSTFAAFIVAFAAGAALAGLGTPERTDAWMVKQPAFIVGTVFHVAPTVPHPHPRMRPRPGQLEAGIQARGLASPLSKSCRTGPRAHWRPAIPSMCSS
jgi:hypothetical protein